MITNSDCCIIINREIDDTSDTEKQYLGFKLEKFRGKPGKDRVYVFLHPFDEENGILLIPDINTKPLSRSRMEDFEPFKNTQVTSQYTSFDSGDTEFRSNFIDIIDDNYKDTSQHYIDIMNKAEEVSNKMRLIQEKEKELKRQREKELKNGKYRKNDKNEIIIQSRNYFNNLYRDSDGRIVIQSRKKNIKDSDGRIVIQSRKDKVKVI